MRFGSASGDEDTVTEVVLAERAEHFLERLRALDGTAKYNIKANHDEEAVLRLSMADHDDIRSLAEANREAGGGTQEEKVRLGEMIAAAVQAREARDAELLEQALQPMAKAVRAGPQCTGWLANLSCLVERGSAERFLAAVDEFRRQHPPRTACQRTAAALQLRRHPPPPSRQKAVPRKRTEPRQSSRTGKKPLTLTGTADPPVAGDVCRARPGSA
jgi:predicted lactoylglutathione lyase